MSLNLKDIPQGRTKHFSFLVKRNKIVNVGWNNYLKTHPMTEKFGYRSSSIHSEFACIISSNNSNSLKDCIMINTRIGKNNELLLSKPCKACQRLLLWHNIPSVIYSTEKGFECLNLKTMKIISTA